jgi:transmembrane sensor
MEPMKLNAQIYEEACEWFVDCRADDFDDSARNRFDSWLRTSPEHLKAYLEIAAIWNEGPLLDPKGKFAAETLIAQAASDRDNVIELSSKRSTGIAAAMHAISGESRRRFRRPHFAAVAASLIVALAVVFIYVRAFQAPTYSAKIGEQRSLALGDGSTVELNSRSAIVVRYSKQERRVDLLQGQALFRVAKDGARPFIVKTGDTLVRAVGTEFDIYQKRAGTIVTVVEGRVAVLTDHGALTDSNLPVVIAETESKSNLPFPTIAPGQMGNIMVAAGEQLTVTPKLIQIAEHPNVANATAWTQRRLVFESASLADVADEFNRYNDRQLIVAGSGLESFHVSGVFSSTDPASLLRFLRARSELNIVETGTEIRIEKSTL